MGFWEYPDTASEDEDSGDISGAVLASHRSPKLNRLGNQKLSDLDNYDAGTKISTKHAIVIPDEDDDGPSPPRKKKRKSVIKRVSLEQECVLAIQESSEALRLQRLREQAMQAFEDDDEDDDDDISDADEEVSRTVPSRVPAGPIDEIEEDDDGDVEAELEAEKQMLLQQASDAASNALVLKVQCKKGHVQIRQQVGSNFVELMDKFRAYAVKQGWAKKSTTMLLECDGDRVDLKNSTPEEFELEDGMILDVVIK